MSKVNRFSLEERYGYQNRKVIYDKDTGDDIELNNIYPIIDLLNQQDKQIKELEQENLSLQEQSIRDNQNWIEETTKLEQQLSDTEESYNNTMKYLNKTRSELLNLPKKIVGEIKEKIKNIKENIRTYYGKYGVINDVDYGQIYGLNKLLRILDQVKGENIVENDGE